MGADKKNVGHLLKPHFFLGGGCKVYYFVSFSGFHSFTLYYIIVRLPILIQKGKKKKKNNEFSATL